jgi:hypothetical protein
MLSYFERTLLWEKLEGGGQYPTGAATPSTNKVSRIMVVKNTKAEKNTKKKSEY